MGPSGDHGRSRVGRCKQPGDSVGSGGLEHPNLHLFCCSQYVEKQQTEQELVSGDAGRNLFSVLPSSILSFTEPNYKLTEVKYLSTYHKGMYFTVQL